MKQKYVIGIDISKSKVDCAVMDFAFKIEYELIIINTEKKLRSFIKDMLKLLKINADELLICCENTGIYNRPLEIVCSDLGVDLWVEHALKIKRASTDMRGKDDRKDALRIAEYGVRYFDRKHSFKEPNAVVKEMNVLNKSRETFLGQKIALENQLREAKSHDPYEYKMLSKAFKKILETLIKSIKIVENELEKLITSDVEINKNKELLTTIPGIGNQIAINFIISTNNFESFENAKHLACYAGVVPFKNQSGTIIKRDRISKMANKNLKRLLHLAAMSCVRCDDEMKTYFQRKVEEGKNKMSVLNAVRNKLVHRIMSVIRKKQPYLKLNEFLSIKNADLTCELT